MSLMEGSSTRRRTTRRFSTSVSPKTSAFRSLMTRARLASRVVSSSGLAIGCFGWPPSANSSNRFSTFQNPTTTSSACAGVDEQNRRVATAKHRILHKGTGMDALRAWHCEVYRHEKEVQERPHATKITALLVMVI